MKIVDILMKEQMSLSFEVFPPKKETSYENVRIATEKIAAMKEAGIQNAMALRGDSPGTIEFE